MFICRLIAFAVVWAFLLSTLAHAGRADSANAGGADFKKTVVPFLAKYCMDCHDNEIKKGGVSLESLTDVSADNASMWKRIWEQVALKEMPPRKKTNQPKLLC